MTNTGPIKLLIALPEDTRSEHGLRAWLATTSLMGQADVRLIVGNRGNIGDPDAAVVFNCENDVALMGQLRASGTPTVYSLGPGAIQDGEFTDVNCHSSDFRTDRKIKMQLASLVHVDTHEQARTARRHFGVDPRWLILPPAPEVESRPRERQKPRSLLMIGHLKEWNAVRWCAENDLQLLQYEEEYHVLNEAMKRTNVIALWARLSHYGERLLGIAATGTPLAAIRGGIVVEGAQAEWFDTDPTEAVNRALAWDQTRIDAQVNSVAGQSWDHWAEQFLEALTCARSS